MTLCLENISETLVKVIIVQLLMQKLLLLDA